MQQVYATMANPLLSEQEKFENTAWEGMNDLTKFQNNVFWFVWIPLAIVWLTSMMVCVVTACWPSEGVLRARRYAMAVEYIVQGFFGGFGEFMLFFFHGSDFGPLLAKNLFALTIMTILLFFFVNGCVAGFHRCRISHEEQCCRDICSNYNWIGLLLIASAGGDGTANAMLQVFAGASMVVAARCTPATVAEESHQTAHFYRQEAGKYALLSISAVLMLCVTPKWPLAWLLDNASLSHPWFALLIFLWIYLGLEFIVQGCSAAMVCKQSCDRIAPSRSGQQQRSKNKKKSSCCKSAFSCCDE